MVRPGGDVRWVKTYRKLLQGPGGKPRGAMGIIEDITEQRAKDDQLKAVREQAEVAELRFRTLCEQLPLGIFQADANANNLYVNGQYAEIIGRTREEALGSGWWKSIHPDEVKAISTACPSRMRVPQRCGCFGRTERPDGFVLAGAFRKVFPVHRAPWWASWKTSPNAVPRTFS